MFLGPLSEIYGRRVIPNIATVHFVLWQIGCALAPNLTTLIVFRLLTGMGGSDCLTIGAASSPTCSRRNTAVRPCRFSLLVRSSGPSSVPSVAGSSRSKQDGDGYVEHCTRNEPNTETWGQVFWTLLIAGGLFTSIILVSYRETNPVILMRQKTRRLAKELNRKDLYSCYDSRRGQYSPTSFTCAA